jgi:hypothetical protein
MSVFFFVAVECFREARPEDDNVFTVALSTKVKAAFFGTLRRALEGQKCCSVNFAGHERYWEIVPPEWWISCE